MGKVKIERKTDCFAWNAESTRCEATINETCNGCSFYKLHATDIIHKTKKGEKKQC